MEQEKICINEEDIRKLIQDVALIKNILISEGELTDWAKKELMIARETPVPEGISHEEVKRRIFKKEK